MSRPVPWRDQVDDGVACEISWPRPEFSVMSTWRGPIRTDVTAIGPAQPCEVRPTDWHSLKVDDDSPLWPAHEAGDHLRKLYLAKGERALCEPDSVGSVPWYLPLWWERW